MTEASVFIVDDDDAARGSLKWLLDSVGYTVECFACATEFLRSYDGRPGCLIVDVRMPGMSGLQLQSELKNKQFCLAIIVVTGHGDVPMAVRAMRDGAIDFLQKPFNNQQLLERTAEAIVKSKSLSKVESARRDVQSHYHKLSNREREVAWLVFAGKSNKEIATALELSCKTVEAHRAAVMTKMEAGSVAELTQRLGRLRPALSRIGEFPGWPPEWPQLNTRDN